MIKKILNSERFAKGKDWIVSGIIAFITAGLCYWVGAKNQYLHDFWEIFFWLFGVTGTIYITVGIYKFYKFRNIMNDTAEHKSNQVSPNWQIPVLVILLFIVVLSYEKKTANDNLPIVGDTVFVFSEKHLAPVDSIRVLKSGKTYYYIEGKVYSSSQLKY